MDFILIKPDFFDSKEFKNLKPSFPLTSHYLKKDPLYVDPNKIQWFQVKDQTFTLGFFSLSLVNKPFEDSQHLLTFEVSSDLRRSGFGTSILFDLVLKYPKISLRCSKKLLPFYFNLGFKLVDQHDDSFLLKTE